MIDEYTENRLLEEEAEAEEEEEAKRNHIGGFSASSFSTGAIDKKWSVMSSKSVTTQLRLTPSNKRKRTKGASKKHITPGWLRMKAFQKQKQQHTDESSTATNLDGGSNGGNTGGVSQVDSAGGSNGISGGNSQISSGINEQFSSCREIECEAGGTCIEEDEPNVSQRNININSIGRRKGSNNVIGGLVVGDGGNNSKSNRKKRIRCRCPLGRRGFFCEKREYNFLSLFACTVWTHFVFLSTCSFARFPLLVTFILEPL